MHDARDAEDKRLLEAGEHTQLLTNYIYLVEEQVSLRVRDREAAEEVVQRVFLRLATELAAEKKYPVPFRVVVWNVVNWTSRGFEWTSKDGASLPEHWEGAAPDELAAWEDEHDLGLLIADLPAGERQVLELLYRDGLSPGQIATLLDMNPNAVYQATHRGHKRVAEKLAR
jgi:RNA polymerase sigma factor (sigma-70 family)